MQCVRYSFIFEEYGQNVMRSHMNSKKDQKAFVAISECTSLKFLPEIAKEIHRLAIFVIYDRVTYAEIIWCTLTVISHSSMRIAEKNASFLKAMFPVSSILQKMQLHRTKISYFVAYD
ncbi:hypothetical protein PR048_001807 [Dryococelus australis]|uniref:Uncharacterized protein n=1 Tax=Dryococelus australis TaxID=614101 RepID=A0ABQ9IIE3_9NEOP|nr:hypothetical protein PR048_001807 [Dryococelus australis]